MAVKCEKKCVKSLHFIFNFLFWLCGLALICLGVNVQVSLHHSLNVRDPRVIGAPIITGIGVLVFFSAFFGCCRVWRENYCLIMLFTILLSLVIAAEIKTAFDGYVFRGTVDTVVNDSLTELFGEWNSSKSNRDTLDEMQRSLKCCGLTNVSDWTLFDPDGITVPDSCCITITPNCGKETMMDAAKVYTQSCIEALQALIKNNNLWVIVTTLVIAALQLFGYVFSCVLMNGICCRVRVVRSTTRPLFTVCSSFTETFRLI